MDLFNAGEFFPCHDVLEEIWSETLSEDRTFYQGLIHAAVALFHFTEGNLGGARKMSFSAQKYLQPYQPEHAGLAMAEFVRDFSACCRELQFATPETLSAVTIDQTQIPHLRWLEFTRPFQNPL
ncbi:MAG: DUF309 domain-containing protein [Planctomycetaceae bacterium]